MHIGHKDRWPAIGLGYASRMKLDDLVVAVRAGERRARTELGQRLLSELELFFRRLVGETDASDLAQMTMIIVMDKLPQFEMIPGKPFLNWVHAIARTQFQEACRKHHRRKRLAEGLAQIEQTPQTNLSSHLARAEQLGMIDEALDDLDSHYRRAIENELQGGDAGDLAEREQIKRGSARTRRRRAIQLLRELILGRGKRDTRTPTTP